ncbi:hypothetical protein MNBD_GAMMA23-2134, partial [hydrothermal vent metagenome]
MNAVVTYNSLALNWSPQNKRDHRFNIFASIVLTITLFIGYVASNIPVPEQTRNTQTVVPERIAKFLTEKKKPVVIKEKPKPLPKPKLKPKIKKKPPAKARKKKPLTKALKKARKKAESSGLLALSNELADLMDTSAVSTMVSGKTSKGAAKAVAVNKDVLSKGVGVGSGGVQSSKYAMASSNTRLSSKELNSFRESLLASNTMRKPNKQTASRADIRLEEQITIVFDQNKSKLYSLYNRARRQAPGLKGKIILQITIAPSG